MSGIRSTRSARRRKMVLPVTVIRREGRESRLAHTLDVTEVSARLGGLGVLLEPEEVIEIQRGSLKARFEVFWMGAPGSAMEGQAGVRTVKSAKVDWGIQLPPDEADHPAGAQQRQPAPALPGAGHGANKRWNTRFECRGSAAVRAVACGMSVSGQVKDISLGGVYVETSVPLPVNTEVYVKLQVEGTSMEAPGVVRACYARAGMGISFQRVSMTNHDRITDLILMLRHKASAGKANGNAARASQRHHPGLHPDCR